MRPLPENRLFLVRGNTTLTRHKQRESVTKISEIQYVNPNFDLSIAVELMRLSNFSYDMYDQFKDGKIWEIPAPFTFDYKNPVKIIYAPSEKVSVAYGESHPIKRLVPVGFITESIVSNNIYISWRGTDNIYEWRQNAKFEQTPCSFLPSPYPQKELVHLGFLELYTGTSDGEPSSQDIVKNYLNSLINKKNKSVWITGHSLGGALSVLNTCDILANISGFKSVKTYNFASPRVGDIDFVNFFNAKSSINGKPSSWRIANDYDLVPMVPPEELGYKHVNQLYSITFGNKLTIPPTIHDIVANHDSLKYFDVLKKQLNG